MLSGFQVLHLDFQELQMDTWRLCPTLHLRQRHCHHGCLYQVSFPDFFHFSGFAVQGDTGDIKLTARTEDRDKDGRQRPPVTFGVSRTTRPVEQRFESSIFSISRFLDLSLIVDVLDLLHILDFLDVPYVVDFLECVDPLWTCRCDYCHTRSMPTCASITEAAATISTPRSENITQAAAAHEG
jgi:hypothetical protein